MLHGKHASFKMRAWMKASKFVRMCTATSLAEFQEPTLCHGVQGVSLDNSPECAHISCDSDPPALPDWMHSDLIPPDFLQGRSSAVRFGAGSAAIAERKQSLRQRQPPQRLQLEPLVLLQPAAESHLSAASDRHSVCRPVARAQQLGRGRACRRRHRERKEAHQDASK